METTVNELCKNLRSLVNTYRPSNKENRKAFAELLASESSVVRQLGFLAYDDEEFEVKVGAQLAARCEKPDRFRQLARSLQGPLLNDG